MEQLHEQSPQTAPPIPTESEFQQTAKPVNVEDEMNRVASRYIWFAGDLMGDAHKSTSPQMKLGGIHFGEDYPGLAITKFMLQRGRITPIILQPKPMPATEPLPHDEVQTFDQLQFTGEQPKGQKFVKVFPKDQLEAIVYGAREGQGKGIVELTPFRGFDWSNPKTRNLIDVTQTSVFPNWTDILNGDAKLPVTLRELEELIMEGQNKLSDNESFVITTREMLQSCEYFRSFGRTYLELEGTRIRAGVNQNSGYVHRYSDVGKVLLRQLEMKEENLLDTPQGNPVSNNGEFAEVVKQMAANQEATARLYDAQLKALSDANAKQADVNAQQSEQIDKLLAAFAAQNAVAEDVSDEEEADTKPKSKAKK